MISPDRVNLSHVKAEMEAEFRKYEQALVDNDITALDNFFWHSPQVVRFGVTENLYGIDAVRSFRANRDAANLARQLQNTMIMTFGEDIAVATTEFSRNNHGPGRQTQVWMKMKEGWRIVSAHISLLD